MRKPLNRMGTLTGGTLLSGALLLCTAFPATAQLYGAGRNSSAVVIDEDVLSSLGGGAPRPGVGIGYLPAPPAAPRSRLNLVPPPKPKAPPAPIPAAAVPPPQSPALSIEPLAPPPVAVPAAAAPDVPAVPADAPPVPLTPPPAPQAAAEPEALRPDPGPPPVPAEPPRPPDVAAAPPPPPPPVSRPATPAAAVPAPTSTAKGVRVLFLPDSPDVPTTARSALDGMVKQLQSQPDRRVLITAYAAGTPETASQSRRLSLNRALAVRSFLAENGISTARVDVRALGGQVGDGPADRVDLDLTTP